MNVHTIATAVRKPVYSSSNNHIKQTPQAGIQRSIQVSAIKALTRNCREDCDCDTLWALAITHFLCVNECFCPLLCILKLDSLIMNHNYFANDALGNSLWCCWETEPKTQGHRNMGPKGNSALFGKKHLKRKFHLKCPLTSVTVAWGGSCSQGCDLWGQRAGASGHQWHTPACSAAPSWWVRPRCHGLSWRTPAGPPEYG